MDVFELMTAWMALDDLSDMRHLGANPDDPNNQGAVPANPDPVDRKADPR
jgi:hypothetical protein